MVKESSLGFSYIETIIVVGILAILIKGILLLGTTQRTEDSLKYATVNVLYTLRSIQQETLYGYKVPNEPKATLMIRPYKYRVYRNYNIQKL